MALKADEIESIDLIEKYCSELLIHAADVEGLCQGVDEELVKKLGEWVTLPCTYAGGARGQSAIDDILYELISRNIRFGICR
jgi:phosphoribosylformimino-5-aminoimidazole carboxamide ribonucleotide (ProFAR) isomerase